MRSAWYLFADSSFKTVLYSYQTRAIQRFSNCHFCCSVGYGLQCRPTCTCTKISISFFWVVCWLTFLFEVHAHVIVVLLKLHSQRALNWAWFWVSQANFIRHQLGLIDVWRVDLQLLSDQICGPRVEFKCELNWTCTRAMPEITRNLLRAGPARIPARELTGTQGDWGLIFHLLQVTTDNENRTMPIARDLQN